MSCLVVVRWPCGGKWVVQWLRAICELWDGHMVAVGESWAACELGATIWWPWVSRGLYVSYGMAIWWPWAACELGDGHMVVMGDM